MAVGTLALVYGATTFLAEAHALFHGCSTAWTVARVAAVSFGIGVLLGMFFSVCKTLLILFSLLLFLIFIMLIKIVVSHNCSVFFILSFFHARFPFFFNEKRFAYLCIFRPFFGGVPKVPNLRFQSAHLTSSKRLFDELIKAL